MAITNYGELKTLLASYLHRSDLTSQIPDFITLAQARINRDLNDSVMTVRATFTADGTSRYVALASEMKKLKDVQVHTSSGRKSLQPLSSNQMETMYSDIVDSGDPEFYCVRGREIEVQPTPGNGTVIEIVYLGRLTEFSADADTNDLLVKNPNIYIYAAMIEASIFIQGDERLPTFTAAYDREVAAINEEAEDYEFSGGSIQIMKLGVSTP